MIRNYYKAPYIQKGHGLGSIFRGVAKFFRPLARNIVNTFKQPTVRNVLKTVGKETLGTGTELLLDSIKGKKYSVGDKVRILKLTKEGVFRKGYKSIFSEEIFTIKRVDARLPQPRYFLCDSKNEEIVGSFQAHELSITRLS